MQIDGVGIAQQPDQLELLEQIIQRFNVTNFVELGLYIGGLAYVMLKRRETHPEFFYIGFETNPNDLHAKVKGRPEIIIADAHGVGAIAQVQSVISKAVGAVLIFSDTFNKPKGMETYASLLRNGDLIMGHDYPGELSDSFLSRFGHEHPYMQEVDPESCRSHGVSLWVCHR